MRARLNAKPGWERHTRSQVGGVEDLAQRLGVSLAVSEAPGDGDVVDGLDVVLGDDEALDGGAGGDGLGDSDADDAGAGDGQEGGEGGGVEEHLGEGWWFVVLWERGDLIDRAGLL